MCGIVAVINKYTNGFTDEQLKAFESLLYIDGLRGLDSTGVFAVDNVGDLVVAKNKGNPCLFLEDGGWTTVRQEMFRKGSALVGHNRKATRGAIYDDNAHPFLINNELCLVHNGTMYGDHKHLKDVEVDSHAIAHVLHEKGIKHVVESINAAYCFFWYDHRKKHLGLLRNTERPMHWFETKDAWYYASEYAFLEFIISRHNLKPLQDIKMQPEHCYTNFILEDNKSWSVTSEEVKPLPKPVSQSYPSNQKWVGYQGYQNGYTLGDAYCDWRDAFKDPYEDDPVVEESVKVITDKPYVSLTDFEGSIANEQKIIMPRELYLKHIDQHHKLTTEWAVLIEARQTEDKSHWQLYLDAVNGDFPVMYKLLVEGGYFQSKEAAAKAVKDGVLFELKLAANRTWVGIDDKQGYLVCRAISGKELPATMPQVH